MLLSHQNTTPTLRSRLSVQLLYALIATTLTTAVSGCASSFRVEHPSEPSESTPSAHTHTSSNYFAQLIAQQQRRPDRKATRAPAPDWLPNRIDVLRSLADNSDAHLSLTETVAIDRFALTPDRPSDHAQPTTIAIENALRRYAAGRLALESGNTAQAVNDLEIATRLDPTHPQPWEALGLAQQALGQRLPAQHSFEQAVQTGSTNPAILLQVALLAQEHNEHDRAVRSLLRVRTLDAMQTDPAIAHIVYVMLSKSLLDQGLLSAAYESLKLGLDLPQRVTQPSQFNEQLASIYRQQSSLHITLGDLALALNTPADAHHAYTRAASNLTDPLPTDLLTRLIYTDLRIGHSARATQRLLDTATANPAAFDQIHRQLLVHIATHTSISPSQIAQAVQNVIASASSDASSLVNLSLTITSLEPPARRLATLESLARTSPTLAVYDALLSAYSNQSPQQIRQRVANLLTDDQSAITILASAALPHPTVFDALTTDNQPTSFTSHTLRAFLLAHAESSSAPLPALIDQLPSANHPLQAASLLIQLVAETGAYTQLDRILSTANPSLTTEQSHLLQARIATVTQNHIRALELYLPLLSSSSPSPLAQPSDYAACAQSAYELADYATASRIATRCTQHHRTDPACLSILLDLYAESGPLPNPAQHAHIYDQLTTHAPNAPELAHARIAQLLRAGQLARAHQEIFTLAQAHPTHRPTIESLVELWTLIAASAPETQPTEVIDWLDPLADRFDHLPWLAAASARFHALAGQEIIATRRLDHALVRHPSAASLIRTQALLAAHAGNPEQAQQMLTQLSIDHTFTIDGAVTHAADILDLNQPATAAEFLSSALPNSATLTGAQTAQLRTSLEAITKAQLSSIISDPSTAAHLLSCYTILHNHSRALPLSHLANHAQIVYIAADPNDTAAFLRRLIDAEQIDELAAYLAQGAEQLRPTLANLFNDSIQASRYLIPYLTLWQFDTDPSPAQFAYLLATRHASGTSPNALTLYDIVLELDPDHAMAANNLGYALLDANEQPDKAARLLEHAYTLEPGDAAVIDSLGWLRYKQRILNDVLAPDGTHTEGALTLLTRAASEPTVGGDPVVNDHLGDARWAAGDHVRATQSWSLALKLARMQLSTIRAQGLAADSSLLSETQQLIRALQSKLAAADDDRQPKIAPQFPLPTATPADIP